MLDVHTVAIVGAGPIGIELAVALQRAGIDAVHLDAGPIGSTMLAWPPQTRWFSSSERIEIAGVPIQTVAQEKCTREEYLAYLRSVVLQFDLPIRTFERVTALRRECDGYELSTQTLAGETHTLRARHVVLTTGGNATHNRLGVPGEDLPHVGHQLRDPHYYFGRRVLVVGGRNSAVEAALRLHHVGADVALSYRGDEPAPGVKYWLRPELDMLVEAGRIEAHFGTIPSRIETDSVTLTPVAGGDAMNVLCDFVLLMIGYVADMSLFRDAGVELVGVREVPHHDEQTMETNLPGLFVAGTATAGTQRSGVRVFLENCHVHVDRIVAKLTGQPPPPTPAPPPMVET